MANRFQKVLRRILRLYLVGKSPHVRHRFYQYREGLQISFEYVIIPPGKKSI